MTSAINPNNIDGAYPVAGQDNDSQGFRDNFTNIKTNFQFAASEITDLQKNAVLKGPLTGTALNNDMGGSPLSNAVLLDMAESCVALGVINSPFNAILNYAAGSVQTMTLPNSASGTVTLSFTNFPIAGLAGRMRVRITVPTGGLGWTITLPSAVSLGTTGIQGYSSNIITFGAVGTYEFEFETIDGGTTITIFDLNRPLVAGFTNQLNVASTLALSSSEDVADAAAISTSVTSSYFTTAGAETATLSAAPAGQIKVLYARDVTAGPMVITVTNPVWGGLGTITFNFNGQACTLMSTGTGWVCIGNNGATFA